MSIKIKNPRRNKLFNDGERKECGRCHKIKSHEYMSIKEKIHNFSFKNNYEIKK
jgi:hypothetical protein